MRIVIALRGNALLRRGPPTPILVLAIVATFVFTTLTREPASIATLLGVLALSSGLDYGWKRSHPSSPVPVQVGH